MIPEAKETADAINSVIPGYTIKGLEDGLDAAMNLLLERVEREKWVKVEDRLPTRMMPVALIGSGGFVCVGTAGDIEKNDDITYWRELPAPPEDENARSD